MSTISPGEGREPQSPSAVVPIAPLTTPEGAKQPAGGQPTPVPTQGLEPPPAEPLMEKRKPMFTLDSAPPTVTARLYLPGVLPNHEPFVFVMRLIFSETMQKKRDAFLQLAPKAQTEQEDNEIL